MLVHFYIFLTSLFAALLAVPSLRKWAFDTGVLDLSDERKVHKGMMPRLGGVAIFFGFIFSLLLFVEMSDTLRGFLAGAMLLFVTGLADDLVGLSPKKKFLGEICGTMVTIVVGKLYITELGNLFGFGDIVLPIYLAIPFTLFAVVGVINAINLIDGLDGLSGGISVIALSSFGLLAYLEGHHEMTLICAAMTGALLGFLNYNSYPARIFMGDVGSLVIGFTLAFLAIGLTQTEGTFIQPIVPLIIIGLPIMDTVWVMSCRMLHGKSPFDADKTHVHHKFLDIGFNHRLSVLIIYGISLFWAVVGIAFRDAPAWLLLFTFIAVSLFLYQILRFIAYRREDFTFSKFDTAASLRHTRVYSWLVRIANYGVAFLGLGFVAILVLTVECSRFTDGSDWQMALVAMMVGAVLLFYIKDTHSSFLQIYLLLVAVLLSFGLEHARSTIVFSGFSVGQISDLLFKCLVPFIAMKFIFKRENEHYMSASLHLLVLAMCVGLAVVSPGLHLPFNLQMVIAKALILFLSLRILVGQGPLLSRQAYGSVLASLLAMLFRSI